jgi:hypothetical protein
MDDSGWDIPGVYALQASAENDHWQIVKLLVQRGATNKDTFKNGMYEDSLAALLEQEGQKALARQLPYRRSSGSCEEKYRVVLACRSGVLSLPRELS